MVEVEHCNSKILSPGGGVRSSGLGVSNAFLPDLPGAWGLTALDSTAP